MTKKNILCFLLFPFVSLSQITITNTDMPNVGDTPRVSIGQIVPGIDFTTTGANQTWDYSYLNAASQRVDTFYDVSLMNTNYALFFVNLPINPNRASIAARTSFIPAVPTITVTDAFGFAYESTSLFQITGVGATINGFATPVAFNSKDIVYNFPLNYNDTDSCDADFNISLPGLGYYGYSHHRVNLVDGWGTVTTPFGSFNCLRVKSSIAARDTIYSDSLQTGFAQDRPVTTEYRFMTNGMRYPVIQISTTMLFGNETITEVIYRDSIRIGISVNEVEKPEAFEMFPNPADENFTLTLTLSPGKYQDAIGEGTSRVELTIIDAAGRELLVSAIRNQRTDVDVSALENGIYFLKLSAGKSYSVRKLIIH